MLLICGKQNQLHLIQIFLQEMSLELLVPIPWSNYKAERFLAPPLLMDMCLLGALADQIGLEKSQPAVEATHVGHSLRVQPQDTKATPTTALTCHSPISTTALTGNNIVMVSHVFRLSMLDI